MATAGDSDAPGFFFGRPAATRFELGDRRFHDPITEVTVPAGGSRSIQVRLTVSGLPDGAITGTRLVFFPITLVDGALPILVPAAGFVGDYQALPTRSQCGRELTPFLAFAFDLFRRNNPCTVGVYGLGDLDSSTLPLPELEGRPADLGGPPFPWGSAAGRGSRPPPGTPARAAGGTVAP